VLEGRIGWRMINRLEVFANARISPANSIISTYKSRYLGGALAFHILNDPNLSVHLGYGRYVSSVKNRGPAGSGNLANAGVSWEAGNNFTIGFNFLMGKISSSSYEPNPFSSDEFNLTFGFAYQY